MSEPEDFTVIHSKLSGIIERDGNTIELCIYRGDAERSWILEVVDAEDGSTVWDERFATEQAAMDELNRTIDREGMGVFSSDQGETKH